MATTTRYTYVDFATDAIALANAEEIANKEVFIKKAQDLIAGQEKKKEYNAANPKKNTAKGASEETMLKANLISTVLNSKPMTTVEINATLKTEYTALQVANAVKFIEGATSVKVIREIVNAKGLRMEKEYTAYAKV